MIVVYRVNPILWHLAARWLLRTRKIAMVNILAGQIDLVPEFIPWYGSNQPVANCAIDLLKHPEKLAEQRQKLRTLMSRMDRPGASMNTYWQPGRVTIPVTRWRVVWARGETIETFSPTRRLSRLDLPMLGRPAMPMVPQRWVMALPPP